MEECKVTPSKASAEYLTYHFFMKRWPLILNDAKKDWPTSLSHSTEILRKSYIWSILKSSSLELLYPDSDNSRQHVLREDEKQGYYRWYFLLLLLEKLSILKLRDFLMWIYFKCDSYIFSYFQFLYTNLHRPPVRSCKPQTAVKAHGITFHAEPDYLAGIKSLPFGVFWTSFCCFWRLALPSDHILREMLNNQTPLFPCTS